MPGYLTVAGIAAVVGRPFSLALLAKATDLDEDSVSSALEELWQRRIIDGCRTNLKHVRWDPLLVVSAKRVWRRWRCRPRFRA